MTAPPRRTARGYEGRTTAASRTGLAEIMTTLRAHRDAQALIGGWAPYLIPKRFGDPAGAAAFAHVGSIDIDSWYRALAHGWSSPACRSTDRCLRAAIRGH